MYLHTVSVLQWGAKLLATLPPITLPLQILDVVLSVLDVSLFVFWVTGV